MKMENEINVTTNADEIIANVVKLKNDVKEYKSTISTKQQLIFDYQKEINTLNMAISDAERKITKLIESIN